MQMFFKHPLHIAYIATKVSGKSSNSTSASLRAQQLLILPLSNSGGLLGSLGRLNSFTLEWSQSLNARSRSLCLHYGRGLLPFPLNTEACWP